MPSRKSETARQEPRPRMGVYYGVDVSEALAILNGVLI